jgi:hypothetical protein
MLCLALSRTLMAGAPVASPGQARIGESDISPQERPMALSHPLDEYVARVQERLKHQLASVQDSGLVEVKLTIRKDGAVTFSEIVVLDGPAVLRNDLLPLIDRLTPLPPPPMDADMLHVSVLLPLGYPGPDLLDALDTLDRIDQEN